MGSDAGSSFVHGAAVAQWIQHCAHIHVPVTSAGSSPTQTQHMGGEIVSFLRVLRPFPPLKLTATI